jgi:DNA polymerase III delta prime subunit
MKNYLWTEENRPHTIEDCILPTSIKKVFQGFLEQKEISNLLLFGPPGVGKTTIAKALCEELNLSYIIINGSDEGRFLDTIRNRVKTFATTKSLVSGGKHKVVIIDEADNTTHDVQLSLRAFIEEYHSNCRFIFTCNFINKIIDALHSRCTVVDFKIKKAEEKKLQALFFERLQGILTANGVTFEDKVLVKLIQRYYPDWRRLLNEAQRHSAGGSLDSAVLCDIADVNTDQLMKAMKNKEYNVVRKWVVDNLDSDANIIIRKIYNSLTEVLEPVTIPPAVLVLAKYQYQIAFVADQEINMLACLTELMIECKWK